MRSSSGGSRDAHRPGVSTAAPRSGTCAIAGGCSRRWRSWARCTRTRSQGAHLHPRCQDGGRALAHDQTPSSRPDVDLVLRAGGAVADGVSGDQADRSGVRAPTRVGAVSMRTAAADDDAGARVPRISLQNSRADPGQKEENAARVTEPPRNNNIYRENASCYINQSQSNARPNPRSARPAARSVQPTGVRCGDKARWWRCPVRSVRRSGGGGSAAKSPRLGVHLVASPSSSRRPLRRRRRAGAAAAGDVAHGRPTRALPPSPKTPDHPRGRRRSPPNVAAPPRGCARSPAVLGVFAWGWGVARCARIWCVREGGKGAVRSLVFVGSPWMHPAGRFSLPSPSRRFSSADAWLATRKMVTARGRAPGERGIGGGRHARRDVT